MEEECNNHGTTKPLIDTAIHRKTGVIWKKSVTTMGQQNHWKVRSHTLVKSPFLLLVSYRHLTSFI